MLVSLVSNFIHYKTIMILFSSSDYTNYPNLLRVTPLAVG